MWLVMLGGLLIAATMHGFTKGPRSLARFAELALVYIVAVYCGIAQVVFGTVALIHGSHVARHMGVPFNAGVMTWLASFMIGFGIVGALSIWLRGNYLIAPVIGWAVFFVGGTFAHLQTHIAAGHPISMAFFLATFATHALVSILLVTLWLAARFGRCDPP